MAGDDELLRGLGVTARGERELARDVIRDAAAAAAAREDARRGGDAGRVDGHVDGTSIGGEGAGAGAAERGPGPGDGPAARELARLRDESERLDREFAAVRDALDEVRRRTLDGDAPVDAALQIAVGERRVQGLADKRDALDAKLREAETNAVAEASERARAGPGGPEVPNSRHRHRHVRRKPTTARNRNRGKRKTPPRARRPGGRRLRRPHGHPRGSNGWSSARGGGVGDVRETERERLIRAGVITPFDALAGFERRTNGNDAAAAEAHVASMSAWKAGRGATKLLEGDAVPKQRPEAREFGRRPRRHAAPGLDAKVAAKRREWRRAAADREGGAGRRRRAGRAVRTRAGAKPVDAGARGTRRTAATRKTPTKGTRTRTRTRRRGRRRRTASTEGISSSRRSSRDRRRRSRRGRVPRARSPTPAKGTRASCARRPGRPVTRPGPADDLTTTTTTCSSSGRSR